MSPALLHVYHALPGPARSCVATLRGFYLRSWRYGAETEELVSQALEREHWTAEQWSAWQQERLPYVLRRAVTRVPYYRAYWAARRQGRCSESWEHLENWPILEKETVRRNPRAFVADDCKIGRMFPEHTSGTSGKPLDLWWSRDTVRRWYALFEARTRRWYGVSRADRWAILGGQLVAPASQARPPYWVWNAALKQLYLSTYHLSPRFAGHYFDALERYQVQYIFGYTSSLAALAEEAVRSGRRVRNLRVAITNAEPVTEDQRRTIEDGFQCKVRETYGMAEIVAAASECEAGHLHLWPEAGVVEYRNGCVSAPEGEPGDLVCTGLINEDMVLVRYRVGDRGIRTAGGDCSCGRTLPVLGGLSGRSNDLLLTKDGRKVFWINPIFYGLPVRETQVIQETAGYVRILCVPAPGFNQETEKCITGRLRDRLGDVAVGIEKLSNIPRGPGGKFRPVICNVAGGRKTA